MFKRFTVLFLAVIVMITIYLYNWRPVFAGYSDCFELYLNSASSSAQIINTKFNTPLLYGNVCGESFKVNSESFNLEKFLSDYSARIIFIEEIEQGVSYYAYSPKIKYRVRLFDKTINLHIFISNQITIGTPLIFGSF